ncbi:MAG: demethoxyubiquinone hydroxylase family protein, partial [Brevundimonas sp.]
MPERLEPEPPGADPATGRRIPLARPGRGASRRRRAEILRVDHAGEYAAVHIYRAQKAVFEGRAGKATLAADMGEMQEQEAVHLARFDALLNAERVRPTLMTPVWRLAAMALGTGT